MASSTSTVAKRLAIVHEFMPERFELVNNNTLAVHVLINPVFDVTCTDFAIISGTDGWLADFHPRPGFADDEVEGVVIIHWTSEYLNHQPLKLRVYTQGFKGFGGLWRAEGIASPFEDMDGVVFDELVASLVPS